MDVPPPGLFGGTIKVVEPGISCGVLITSSWLFNVAK